MHATDTLHQTKEPTAGSLPFLRLHRGWLLFLIYYVATYALFAAAAFLLVGPKVLTAVALSIVALQALRLVPSPPVRRAVLWMNEQVLLWFYRINYLTTLTLAIGICLLPFALLAYLGNLVGGTSLAVGTFVGLIALVPAVLAWRTWSDRRKVKSFTAQPAGKRVAVIGAGVAGIVSAKECLQEGMDVVVFEKSAQWGGVWNSSDDRSKRTTGRTMSSSSRHNSFFGDFPMEGESSNDMYPTHYSEAEYRQYLDDYVDHFDVADKVEFDVQVESTERQEDGSWVVKVVGSDGVSRAERFDNVIVCTGLNHQRNALSIEGAESDAGTATTFRHAADYRDPEVYRGKKVVIVGMGESSSDVASEIANVADEVHVIVRSPVLLLPRNTFGKRIAPDHKLSRLVLGCPQFIRTWKLLSQTTMHGFFNRFTTKYLGLAGRFGTTLDKDAPYEDNWSPEWFELFYKLGFSHPKAGWGLTRNQVTKTAPIVRAYRAGTLHFHTADVTNRSGSTIRLDDGTVIENVDGVLDATGYKPRWPFMPAGYEGHDSRDRYRLVFHPELPGMSFVGFCRGSVGSVFQAMEMQARWSALVFSGARRLPDTESMTSLVEAHRSQMIGKWPTKVSMVYANAIARKEIGCEPNLWAIFRRSPKIWFYLLAGPYTMSMYRFEGPHARPDIANEVYEAGPQLVRPLEFGLQQGMELALGSLTRFWTSVPPLAGIRTSNPAVRAAATPFIDLEY